MKYKSLKLQVITHNMTEKQARILDTALRLFAQQGYDATSTQAIARQAEVSEGLIFRHFGNKVGLLAAIMAEGEQRLAHWYKKAFDEITPAGQLRALISLPFQVPEREYPWWKLLYSLKWQKEEYDHQLINQLRLGMTEIFRQLEYSQPALEAELVLVLFDGLATALLLKQTEQAQALQQLLFEKYQLNSIQ